MGFIFSVIRLVDSLSGHFKALAFSDHPHSKAHGSYLKYYCWALDFGGWSLLILRVLQQLVQHYFHSWQLPLIFEAISFLDLKIS